MTYRFLPRALRRATFLCVLCAWIPNPCARAEVGGEGPNPNDPVVGVLEEGKAYCKLNGESIYGKEVADVLLEDGDRWKRAVEDFARRELIRAEMDRLGATVNDQEVKDGLLRVARMYAMQAGMDPTKLSADNLASEVGLDLRFLEEEVRTTLGLKKVLVELKLLEPNLPLEHPTTKGKMEEFLKKLVEKYEVVVESDKLQAGEALRIEQRGYSIAEVRHFALQQLGPLTQSKLRQALEILKLERLARAALSEKGFKELPEGERSAYYTYLVRQIEYEQGVPDGKPILDRNIQQSGMSVQQFLKDRRIFFDMVMAFLAKQTISFADLKAEFEAHPEVYTTKDKLLAHIFLRVYDPQGRAYAPDWLVPGHTRLNEEVQRVREERFEAARPKIESLIGLAHADFEKAAREHSDDENTKAAEGRFGQRLSAKSIPPPPLDAEVLKLALELKAGELSKPLRSAYGWHLFKCLEQQDVDFKTEKKVQERVYVNLIKRKRAELAESVSKQAKVEELF
ncbi:MAG: peptidylprolyl isomerase [Planctomycetota bacterium]|nr:peptidylprolyl isomerase [Planctomycetota bacterium]